MRKRSGDVSALFELGLTKNLEIDVPRRHVEEVGQPHTLGDPVLNRIFHDYEDVVVARAPRSSGSPRAVEDHFEHPVAGRRQHSVGDLPGDLQILFGYHVRAPRAMIGIIPTVRA
jgi:hypothetical protein